MSSDRAGGSKYTTCRVVLIGRDRILRKQVALVLRGAGFRIVTLAPETHLALLRAVACECEAVSVVEVSDIVEEPSHQYSRAPHPAGSSDKGDAAKNRSSTPSKSRKPVRVGRGADGISEKAASSRSVLPVAIVRERGPTGRQAMILKSLVNGDSNKVVARKLHIAEETVKVHMKRLLRRIGVKNRTQAAIWALNNYSSLAAGGTGDLRRARSLTQSARRSGGPRSEPGAPTTPQIGRPRGGDSKSRAKTVRKSNFAKYH